MIQLMIIDMSLTEALAVTIGGGIGALAKDCLVDNALELPFKKDGKLFLGFIGAAIVGAFIGFVVDGSLITAMLGGYSGRSVLESLLAKPVKREDVM